MDKNRLIVALDVDTKGKALALAEELKDVVGMFKIGSELFTSCGPGIIKEIRTLGCEVFLDLKFHDIPNTVAKASAAAVKSGAAIFNVHASGGPDMMKKAAEAAAQEARALKSKKPKVIAVTVLTSMDQNNLKKIGVDGNMDDQVLRLARLARSSGLDGVVASASEVKLIRKDIGKDFLIVTPGVRPAWAAKDDQKRVATPKEAVACGADLIVVGRPIIEAPDPVDAAKRIVKEISEA